MSLHRIFDLSRDPFAPVADHALFWEDAARARLREEAVRALQGGRGVWVGGDPGSGRTALLSAIAAQAGLEGHRVLFREGPAPKDALGFLAFLLEVTDTPNPPEDVISASEELYVRVLKGFRSSGTVVVVPGTEPLSAEALAEAEILSDLRVAGHPVAALCLCGGWDCPSESFVQVRLPPPDHRALRDFLAHRTAACGRSDLFSEDRLARIAEEARGFEHALSLAARELSRMSFGGTGALPRSHDDLVRLPEPVERKPPP